MEKKNRSAEVKVPGISGLATMIVLNRKNSEVVNKIPDVNKFFNKSNFDAKIKEIWGKYFIATDYNKFTSDILDSKTKQK